MKTGFLVAGMMLVAAPLAAQDFQPPQEESAPSSISLGITGFAARAGVDFTGTNQLLASIALDVADLYSEQLRIRPSGEIGIGGGIDTYLVNLDVMYRFTRDSERAVPYVGVGLGLFTINPGCGPAPGCPKLWPQFTLGFELNFRPGINWLLEYRGEDTLRRHRFFIGLSTRRVS
jgi:hypothetical protein